MNIKSLLYENLLFSIKKNKIIKPKLIIIIKKKHILLANKRNYLKRIIKESFKLNKNLKKTTIIIKTINKIDLKNIKFICLKKIWPRVINL